MKRIVIYKSKYGATEKYARWIAEDLNCAVKDAAQVTVADLAQYDEIIYGGGLYAERIAGICLLTKNWEMLRDKRVLVFTTGLTPIDYKPYYEKLVVEKNFKQGVPHNVTLFHFLGKMIVSELSLPHKTAVWALKKMMAGKENPTEAEKLLLTLCDADGDFCDRAQIADLVAFAKAE